MLDIKQIGKDLKELRKATGKNQEQFAAAAGINVGKVQRIEAGQDSINADDFAKWLEAANTDVLTYLNQYSICEELKGLQEDRDLAVLFCRALKIPEKRKLLSPFLHGLFPEGKPGGKNQR